MINNVLHIGLGAGTSSSRSGSGTATNANSSRPSATTSQHSNSGAYYSSNAPTPAQAAEAEFQKHANAAVAASGAATSDKTGYETIVSANETIITTPDGTYTYNNADGQLLAFEQSQTNSDMTLYLYLAALGVFAVFMLMRGKNANNKKK